MQQKFIDQTGTVAFTSFITQQDGRWKKSSNLVWQLLASQWFCQPRPLDAFPWGRGCDFVWHNFLRNFTFQIVLSKTRKHDCEARLTTKHASNSPVPFVTHKRLAVLFSLLSVSCCVSSLWEHNQGAREGWPSHHPLRWDAIIVSRDHSQPRPLVRWQNIEWR